MFQTQRHFKKKFFGYIMIKNLLDILDIPKLINSLHGIIGGQG